MFGALKICRDGGGGIESKITDEEKKVREWNWIPSKQVTIQLDSFDKFFSIVSFFFSIPFLVLVSNEYGLLFE